MQNANAHKIDPVVLQKNYQRAVSHIRFTMELCRLQHDAGRHYLFGHPAPARSWQEDCVLEFLDISVSF